jgi:hypothetical protein
MALGTFHSLCLATFHLTQPPPTHPSLHPPHAQAERMTLGTFHSLCLAILRRDIEHLQGQGLPYRRGFAVYDQADSVKVVRRGVGGGGGTMEGSLFGFGSVRCMRPSRLFSSGEGATGGNRGSGWGVNGKDCFYGPILCSHIHGPRRRRCAHPLPPAPHSPTPTAPRRWLTRPSPSS